MDAIEIENAMAAMGEAKEAGITFELDGEALKLTGPEEWRPKLKPHAEAIKRYLRDGSFDEPEPEPVVQRNAYQPFPAHLLPSPLRELVTEASKAIGCDESFVALPLLSCVGATIGNTARIVVKKGWTPPACIWTMIVGESGTAKSPAFKVAKGPIQRQQKAMLDEHSVAMDGYEQEKQQYDAAIKEHKRSKSSEPPPEQPEYPQPERVVVSDTTVEALAPLLQQNPRGLLLQRDELSGWLGGFNAYKSSQGADEAHWLSMFDGESMTVDRKGEGTRPTFVETALVSITGGIQPSVLAKAMGREHRASGMASRFLIASPPRKSQLWTDEEVSESTQQAVDRLFLSLQEIQFADSASEPHYIGLDATAKREFITFFNYHHQEQSELTGDSAAAWSKLLGYVPRLALLIHIVKQVNAGHDIEVAADASTMRDAIGLVEWFKAEASRLYATIDDDDATRELRAMADWITRTKGGECTMRELVQGQRSIVNTDAANEIGTQMVRARLAAWHTYEPGEQGGAPKRVLRVGQASTST